MQIHFQIEYLTKWGESLFLCLNMPDGTQLCIDMCNNGQGTWFADYDFNDDEYVFSARLEIDYLNETYNLDLPVSDDYETLAGMVLHYYENIPEVGEELTIGSYKIKVLKATDMKLEELELKRVQ